MLNRQSETFFECSASFEQADYVLFGAPYDSTTSFRPGARFGSAHMRAESFGLETYSPYQDKDIADLNIFDAGELPLPMGAPESTLGIIEAAVSGILADGKLPLMLGGEHLVSLGAMRAAAKAYPDLHILHFDAHADLRDEYLGQKLSHASVIRRVWDVIGDGRIHQFGIRSGDRSEFTWAKEHVSFHPFGFDNLEHSLNALNGKPVYFTLDLDVLDPSECPGTGTPEAGGVSFLTLLDAIIKVGRLNIIGCDIVELCPVYDQSGASTSLACKVLRELLLSLS